MRLILCLLLVVLAVCCYEANAAPVCYAVKRETFTFLLKSEAELKKNLENYNAPPEAVEAFLKGKRCADSTMSFLDKKSVAGVLSSLR
ncbi:prostatic steroid-binding protein C1-like [Microtus ochrogaster]|uniref:Prostatic steroid-binding protein C1-like n=1 Tax=Microtus ochrogaster TaxID=79684 RepID=A0ABM0LNN0_MICOH|nr:prostatic steroid-binding protein C1-like [Microtus ochrogaster]